jgi:uncharacterized protein YqeY
MISEADVRRNQAYLRRHPSLLRPAKYNPPMTIAEKISQDMVAAMKARDEVRLITIRMMKSAVKNREIEKRAPLEDAETMQVLSTMIKQRKESIEQFTMGNRPELAAKEAEEIKLIEGYLPKSASEEDIRGAVQAAIAEIGSPTMKDMGTVMKAVMARFQGARVDGKAVSEAVKQALSKPA